MWDGIINQATHNVQVLKDPEAVKQLANILKTNVRACKALGHPYVVQLGRIYLDMLNVYKVRMFQMCANDWLYFLSYCVGGWVSLIDLFTQALVCLTL